MSTILIEKLGQYSQDLYSAAEKAGTTPIWVKKGEIPKVALDNIIGFNGSIEGAKFFRKVTHNSFHLTWENYDCTNYYPYYSGELLNEDYVILPLSEIARRKYWVWGTFGKECKIFLRPNSGQKTLNAGVFDIEEIDKVLLEFSHLSKELFIVSTPKNILGEWRFVCTPEKIITVSSYKFQGLRTELPSAPKDVTEFCGKTLNLYAPDKIFCLDVAKEINGRISLCELTSFGSASLYAADKIKIIEALKNI